MVSLDLRRDIARVIRQVRPATGWCRQSPQRDWSRLFASHPDHLAAGEATICAVYPDSRNPFAFPELAAEGLDAHIVDEVFVMGGPTPDTFVDVTDTFAGRSPPSGPTAARPARRTLEGFLRAGWRRTAAAGGLPPGGWPRSSSGSTPARGPFGLRRRRRAGKVRRTVWR